MNVAEAALETHGKPGDHAPPDAPRRRALFRSLRRIRKLLVRITADKLFHNAAAPPCAGGFARSLREAPLQRFHSIIIGSQLTKAKLIDQGEIGNYS